jgi:Zinc-binding loop region of homing endonuclease
MAIGDSVGKKRLLVGQLLIKDMLQAGVASKKQKKLAENDIVSTNPLSAPLNLTATSLTPHFDVSPTSATDSHLAAANATKLATEVAESIRILESIAAEASKLAVSSSVSSKDVDALRSKFNSIVRPHTSISFGSIAGPTSLNPPITQSCLQLAMGKTIAKDDPTLTVVTKSTTARELFALTPKQAAWSLYGMCRGYSSKAGPIAPAELRGPYGCWISKARTHLHGGHCQMIPWLEASGPRSNVRLGGGLKNLALKRQPQTLHRLAVRAWKPLSEVRLILEDSASAGTPGFEVSHLCHQPDCFNPDHLTIERKARNNLRNECPKFGQCVCRQQPPCLIVFVGQSRVT